MEVFIIQIHEHIPCVLDFYNDYESISISSEVIESESEEKKEVKEE